MPAIDLLPNYAERLLCWKFKRIMFRGLRLVITSRPELQVQGTLQNVQAININADKDSETDIGALLEDSMKPIRVYHGLEADWPGYEY